MQKQVQPVIIMMTDQPTQKLTTLPALWHEIRMPAQMTLSGTPNGDQQNSMVSINKEILHIIYN